MDARPQVIPVCIAGLCNNLPRQVARNWNREDVIRIHFGPQIDLSDFFQKPDRLRTHKEIADAVMGKIAELGEQDRARQLEHGLRGFRRIEHVGSDR
jgi:1-acyl-sn-glycerol-3-phosphate acyltransferase